MILVVLVVLSLASMATGTRGLFIHSGVRTVVSMTAYPFLKALRSIQDGAAYTTGLVFSYDAARKETEAARQRLGDLMQRAARRDELLQENARLRRLLDFVRNEPGLALEPVQVIESLKGVLTIDRGSLQGIRESMCVVTEDGIVGIVTQTEPLTANVITLHNPDCSVGAMIVRNRVRGRVRGSGSDLSRYCSMNYIDMKDDVRVDDLVVTSPGSIFPSGYPIGRVVSVLGESGSLWKSAEVEPAADPYRLDEVLILRQAVTPIEEMAGTEPAAIAVSAAPAIPDQRSLQERYAP